MEVDVRQTRNSSTLKDAARIRMDRYLSYMCRLFCDTLHGVTLFFPIYVSRQKRSGYCYIPTQSAMCAFQWFALEEKKKHPRIERVCEYLLELEQKLCPVSDEETMGWIHSNASRVSVFGRRKRKTSKVGEGRERKRGKVGYMVAYEILLDILKQNPSPYPGDATLLQVKKEFAKPRPSHQQLKNRLANGSYSAVSLEPFECFLNMETPKEFFSMDSSFLAWQSFFDNELWKSMMGDRDGKQVVLRWSVAAQHVGYRITKACDADGKVVQPKPFVELIRTMEQKKKRRREPKGNSLNRKLGLSVRSRKKNKR
jgi:hypothetical protein